MDKLILFICSIILIGIGSADAALTFTSSDTHSACFEGLVDGDATGHEFCLNTLISNYEDLHSAYNSTDRDLVYVQGLYYELENDITAIYNADVLRLTGEVQLWKNKYNYVIVQHGNYSVQDQITNLTERVSTVETKAKTNESLIYIIQNMLRTVQVDIDSIWLKINSVR